MQHASTLGLPAEHPAELPLSPPRASQGRSRAASSGQDAIQKATHCLERAGRRMRFERMEDADEVLRLLRAATTHLLDAATR
jgi:hypothetical protein